MRGAKRRRWIISESEEWGLGRGGVREEANNKEEGRVRGNHTMSRLTQKVAKRNIAIFDIYPLAGTMVEFDLTHGPY